MTESEFNKKIGNQLKLLRTKHNLTAKQLSETLMISEGALSNYENGTRSLPIYCLYLIQTKFLEKFF